MYAANSELYITEQTIVIYIPELYSRIQDKYYTKDWKAYECLQRDLSAKASNSTKFLDDLAIFLQSWVYLMSRHIVASNIQVSIDKISVGQIICIVMLKITLAYISHLKVEFIRPKRESEQQNRKESDYDICRPNCVTRASTASDFHRCIIRLITYIQMRRKYVSAMIYSNAKSDLLWLYWCQVSDHFRIWRKLENAL